MTVKVSPAVAPASLRPMPGTAVTEPCCRSSLAGAVSTGSSGVTATAMVCDGAMLSKLSEALITSGSAPACASVSVTVARAALTSASEPAISSSVPPPPDTLAPLGVAARSP